MEDVGRRKCPGAGKFTTVLITCCYSSWALAQPWIWQATSFQFCADFAVFLLLTACGMAKGDPGQCGKQNRHNLKALSQTYHPSNGGYFPCSPTPNPRDLTTFYLSPGIPPSFISLFGTHQPPSFAFVATPR